MTLSTLETNENDLTQDLIAENDFLLKLVDTIPVKYYFDYDIREKITSEKHSLMDKKAAELKKMSLNTNFMMSAKSKHKRAKMDPMCQKRVSEIQMELNENEKKRKKKRKKAITSASVTRAANIEELQKRLQERLSEFKSKRKARIQEESRRKKEKISKAKEKLVKTTKGISSKKAEQNFQQKNIQSNPPKKSFNKEGKIIYGMLDFSEEGTVDCSKKAELSGKKYKHLLHKVEKKKEKIEQLKDQDPDKAQALLEKEKWAKAILRSENVKVKDDPTLLKKSIKKQEKLKKSKAKAWKERTDQVEKRQKARQDKRSRNINKKKKEKQEHKLKHAKKKGRIIPGF